MTLTLRIEQWFSPLGAPCSQNHRHSHQIRSCVQDPSARRAQDRASAFWNLFLGGTSSAVTGEGITEAIDQIIDFSERLVHARKGEVLLTRLDQVKAVPSRQAICERAPKRRKSIFLRPI